MTYNVIGKGVATARGHYPMQRGGTRVVRPGETFDLIEGFAKGTWFKALETPAVPAPEPSAPDRKGKGKTKVDDIV